MLVPAYLSISLPRCIWHSGALCFPLPLSLAGRSSARKSRQNFTTVSDNIRIVLSLIVLLNGAYMYGHIDIVACAGLSVSMASGGRERNSSTGSST